MFHSKRITCYKTSYLHLAELPGADLLVEEEVAVEREGGRKAGR
jgi:hypothetical protein